MTVTVKDDSTIMTGPPKDGSDLLKRLERRMGSMKLMGDRDDLLVDCAVYIGAKTRGEQITALAFAAFSRWCHEHDPDGNLGVLEQVDAYSEWCKGQSK